MKLAHDVQLTMNEASATNVGSIVPKVLHVKRGTTVSELKLPALTQCNILPNNNSGNVTANRIGDGMLVPSLLVPEQIGNLASIDESGSAAGTSPVPELYKAVRIGSVVQLVPLCNNYVSLMKQ
jgi:hypothetical protein